MAALIVAMIRGKLNPPADVTQSFTNKTVLVTGANSGLGFESAIKFAKLGASKLILAVRSQDKGEVAKKEILARTGRTDAENIEVWICDMLDYNSIKAFADRVNTELPVLHVAVLNAGIYSVKYATSSYGFEKDIQVNALSTVYLALLLLFKLKMTSISTSKASTLEFVSSGTYRIVKLDETESQAEKPLELFNNPSHEWNHNKQYGVSKLFLMCAFLHLTKLMTDTDGTPVVNVVSCCPGFTQSDLIRDFQFGRVVTFIVGLIMTLFFRTAEQGSRTVVSGAVAGAKVHGMFWQNDEIKGHRPWLDGKEGKERADIVWFEILDALSKDIPGVKELIKV